MEIRVYPPPGLVKRVIYTFKEIDAFELLQAIAFQTETHCSKYFSVVADTG